MPDNIPYDVTLYSAHRTSAVTRVFAASEFGARGHRIATGGHHHGAGSDSPPHPQFSTPEVTDMKLRINTPFTVGQRVASERRTNYNVSNVFDARGENVMTISGVPVNTTRDGVLAAGVPAFTEALRRADRLVAMINTYDEMVRLIRRVAHSVEAGDGVNADRLRDMNAIIEREALSDLDVPGDDWSQCGGDCPMNMSPHFKKAKGDDDRIAWCPFCKTEHTGGRTCMGYHP